MYCPSICTSIRPCTLGFQGRIQEFKLGDALKILFGVFRVKNHDFTQKNLNFSNFRGAPGAPTPLDPPLVLVNLSIYVKLLNIINGIPLTTVTVSDCPFCNFKLFFLLCRNRFNFHFLERYD